MVMLNVVIFACSNLARRYQRFATDEAADRLSLRHNVNKGDVCVVDMHLVTLQDCTMIEIYLGS